MSEHMIPIPSRVYNAAVDGHVAGADQIIDDKTGLTLDKVAGGALEEKEYASDSNNGMGRVVLRKNIVEGINTLTQSMINQPNTIYVIQYDFDLSTKNEELNIEYISQIFNQRNIQILYNDICALSLNFRLNIFRELLSRAKLVFLPGLSQKVPFQYSSPHFILKFLQKGLNIYEA